MDFLAREAVDIYDANRPEVWREKSGAPRTAFAAHLYNEAFGLLGAHPRMIDPIEQIFGEKVYMHQFKINAKAAFTGDVWQWHQDYGTWKRDDGMPEPRAMNIAIFLDEVMPINGPLMLVPKSQHAGDLKASHDLETTSYPLWTLDEATVTRLVKEGGIVAPTGKAGGMLMFHGNLVHGSAGNITPYPRKIVYLTLNAVSNYIRTPTRPEYIAHRDFTPIQTVDDDALLRLARAPSAGGGVAYRALPLHRHARSSSQLATALSRAAEVPGIHVLISQRHRTWMAGHLREDALRACPAMTEINAAAFATDHSLDSSHEPLPSPQRPPRGRQAGSRRADRRRQIRLDVFVAGAAHAGAGGAAHHRPRPRPRARGVPHRRLGRGADRATAFTDDGVRAIAGGAMDVVVEATGNPAVGIRHARAAIAAGKHVVMVNVEADVLAGPLLAEEARKAGVVYSLAYGDQPALTAEMVDWARATGFRVVAAGKGTKYLPAYHDVTPEGVWSHYGLTAGEAQSAGMNPQMFNSFLDGTKSAIEMAAIANATGPRRAHRTACCFRPAASTICRM